MNEEHKKRYAGWLATPPEERVPRTQYALAEELGVVPSQLSALKRELELVEAPPSEVTAFIKTVKKYADSGKNPAWATLYWNIINPSKREIQEAEFSPDDYINIGIKVVEQLQEGYRSSGGSCPVCGQRQISSNEVRLDTEPEHTED